MIRMAPSSVRRRPARARRRDFTASESAAVPARSKRSWTADATLLTFWPPGPEPRTNVSEKSPSGITTPGVTSIVILINPSLLRRFNEPSTRFEYPELPLGDGDLHAVVLEQAPDRAIHIGPDIVDAVHGVGDPEAHFNAHSVILE